MPVTHGICIKHWVWPSPWDETHFMSCTHSPFPYLHSTLASVAAPSFQDGNITLHVTAPSWAPGQSPLHVTQQLLPLRISSTLSAPLLYRGLL